MLKIWLKDKIGKPILNLLKQGLSPEKLSLSMALGAVIGIFKDKKIRSCFSKADKSKMVDSVSTSAAARRKEEVHILNHKYSNPIFNIKDASPGLFLNSNDCHFESNRQ